MDQSINSNDSPNPLSGVGGISAMIFAAGLGTRLKPFTENHPKALMPVNGKTLLQRNIEYLQRFGITNVIVNVHHFADQVIAAVNENNGWGSIVVISDETDAVLETGGGLKKAAWYFKDAAYFVVVNADVLTDMNLEEMIQTHLAKKPLATLAVTNRTTSRYFLFDDDNVLCGWVNEKTSEERIARPSVSLHKMAFSGIHIISNELLKQITQEGKFSIVDVYLQLAKTNIIKGFDHSDAKFIDVGKPESIAVAESLFV